MEHQNRPVFIISAPSGSGKTTMVKQLMERFDCFGFSVSATTRNPRGQEKDGIDYHFLAQEEFERLIKEDAFLEWEEVYPGRFYGTLKSEVDRICQMGRFPIFDVDVIGGLNIKRQFGDRACAIFIQAPSLEVLGQRLRGRGTDNEEAIIERISKAVEEIEYADQFDHVIVNDVLEKSAAKLISIVDQKISAFQSQC